ncbi:rho guanine nucleotide exchange factor 1, partial [Melopsittacus undulatus]|uniref:rho guanine nucleotide exchange factor 1 n=1 Tax=Melopsittacus undulatus TaxID=13146 RepID=UPI00146EB442
SRPQLCFLHSELLLGMGPKEGRKQFLEFWQLFLDKGALLRVPIPLHLQPELARLRPEAVPEQQQRRILREVGEGQEAELERDLRHFRAKRLLGMTPGEAELAALESLPVDPSIRLQRERDLAEGMLERLEDVHLTISSDEEKCSAIFGAILTYMKHLGVRPKGNDGKKSKSHFFRKKHSGSRKPEEAPGRTRRGFLLPGGALWGRDPHSDKCPPQDKKGPKGAELGAGPRARGGAAPPDPPPNVSPTVGDGSEGDTGLDPQEPGAPPTPRGLGPPEPPPEEGGEEEEEEEPWRALVPPPLLQGLSKRELRRQEVINELVLTERTHVRVLRVLLELFHGPSLRGGFFPPTDLHNIFPGLEELVEAHALFLGSLRRRQEESGFVIGAIGDLLLARFEGPEGLWFQKISARFCSRQPFALEQLKAKQRKDARFNHLIQAAESHPRCRRLQLRDIIPSEMQRLTKYPLLLQSISACTEDAEDRARVEKAADCCRRILDHVNQEVREMENFMKLKDFQRRLDLSGLKQSSEPWLSEFKGTELTKRQLVHEGLLSWRLGKDKAVDAHALLLDSLLVLLQRQDERLLLRSQSRGPAHAHDGSRLLSPVIRLRAAMTRLVATDPKAFYVIVSWDSGAQIYELGAQTVAERKNWCDLINETAGALPPPGSQRGKGGRGEAPPPTPLEEAENGGGPKETLDEVLVPSEQGLAAAALERGVTCPPPEVGEELQGLEETLLKLKELEQSFWQLRETLSKAGPTGGSDT